MAIVKSNFVKRGREAKARAKATIRYIQHRPGKDNEKIIRTLFGNDGVMERADAYRMIDEAKKADTLFRFVISPDPKGEDQKQDLNMRQVTQQTMLKIEQITGRTVLWTGTIHADHTAVRHVHALAIVPGRLTAVHLQALTREATRACRTQRYELDLAQKRKQLENQLREEAEWGRGL